MKSHTIKLCLTVAIAGICIAQQATATIIEDTYWGGDDHGWGDRIGNHTTTGGGYTFEIHNMDVTLTDTILNVQINTNYAGHAGLYGTGYGDLFLSSSWNPVGSEADHYIDDNNTYGTKWTYGFSIDGDRYDKNNAGGNGILYEFTDSSTNANNAILSDAVTSNTYRNGQEVIVKDRRFAVSNGTWSISDLDTNDFISFSINLADT